MNCQLLPLYFPATVALDPTAKLAALLPVLVLIALETLETTFEALPTLLKNRKFTVQAILDDYSVLVDYLEKCRKLLDILDSEEVIEAKTEFRDSVIMALEHYGVTNEKTYHMAADLHELAFLRRDALRAIEVLECHQFLQGDPDGSRPAYNDTVHEFWNINSLIKMMTQTKQSGITLNLIRDPLATSSIFQTAAAEAIILDRTRESAKKLRTEGNSRAVFRLCLTSITIGPL